MTISFDALAAIFCLAVMLVGLIGIVLPFFPGITLIWFGAFLYAVITKFQDVTVPFLSLLGILALLTYVLQYWHQRWGLKQLRITPAAVLGASLAGILAAPFGLFPSLTVAPVLGAVFGEMLTGRDSIFVLETDAFKLIGYIGSSIVNITIGVVMLGLFLAKVF